MAIFAGSCASSTPDTALAESEHSSAAEIVQEKSEYEKKMDRVYDSIARQASEGAIKAQAANPQTVALVRNRADFTSDGVFFYDSGQVKFVDVSQNSRKETYQCCFVASEAQYFVVYLKIANSVFFDYRGFINKDNGIIVTNNLDVSGRTYGDTVLDGILNSSKWGKLPVLSDAQTDGRITYQEYMKIETGMSYDEVTEIIGSYGTEISRSEIAGYVTVMVAWEGDGAIGANANVTFQNGSVVAKAQFGLQ